MIKFDKQLFAQLLLKAKGERTINQFALHSGISSAHISRLSRGLLDTPPNAETIRKIADKAYNQVTYYDLMQAAGHLHFVKEDDNSSHYSPLMANLPVYPVVAGQLEAEPTSHLNVPISLAGDADMAVQYASDLSQDAGVYWDDLLFLKKGVLATNGQQVLVLLNHQLLVRRFYKIKNKVKLEPDNSSLPPVNADLVEVIGVIRAIMRRFDS